MEALWKHCDGNVEGLCGHWLWNWLIDVYIRIAQCTYPAKFQKGRERQDNILPADLALIAGLLDELVALDIHTQHHGPCVRRFWPRVSTRPRL